MTITVEEARKRLPPEYSQISDEEIRRMLDYMYFVCDFAWNWQKEHPGENRADRKKIEPKEQNNATIESILEPEVLDKVSSEAPKSVKVRKPRQKKDKTDE